MSIAQYLTRLARGVSAQGVLGPDKGGTGVTGPGPTGNVLVSDGTGWVSQAGGVGPTGPTGPQGTNGTIGVDGATGPTGPAGITGPTGPAGSGGGGGGGNAFAASLLFGL